MFIIALAIVSSFFVLYKINNIKSKYNINTKNIMGIVTHIEYKEDKMLIYIKSKENILINYYGEKNIDLGDKINVSGELKIPNNNTVFNLFNYKKYLLSKNIHYIVDAKKVEIVNKNRNIFYSIKNYLINRIEKINKKEYLYAFIFGNTSYINDDILTTYSENGISHLFSVSGMHITLISAFVLFVLNKIKKNKFNYTIVIIFLVFYMFLTNFTPSIIRATFLFIFIFVNGQLKLDISTFRILLIILFTSLLINPYIIYNIGFIFSYVVSLYLIKFSSLINSKKSYLSKLFMTSFIAFFVSVPIMINNYFSINLLSILNNMIFVPLVSIIIFPLSLLTILIPKLSSIFSLFVEVLEFTSNFMINLKFELVLKKVNILIIIIYYIIITFILYKFEAKKYGYIFLFFIMLIIHFYINITSNPYITFISVGQGDSIFINVGNNKSNLLIDTGGLYNYNLHKNTINYLKSEGITKINYLIITHGDFDHMGEAINLVNNFKVEKVIFNCGPFNDLEKDLIKVLDKKKIKYYSCIKELNIDKNKLYFLQTKEYDNENDNSNVIYTELNGYKFMFMGDASTTTEKEILDKYNLPDIDVLKVGHHGSKTSSGKEFIDEINPQYSIISVGKNNRYGHPNKEVLNNLANSKIYRTDEDGSVMFKINNDKLKIDTCK